MSKKILLLFLTGLCWLQPGQAFSGRARGVGCFGGGPAITNPIGLTPVPSLSTNSFERIFSVLQRFVPEPVEFSVDMRSYRFDAYADLQGEKRVVRMSLGLLFDSMMDEDALALVACHELGHHFGGPPGFSDPPLSFEGQADYYSTQACFSFWARHVEPAKKPAQESYEYCRNILGRETEECARVLQTSWNLTRMVARRMKSPETNIFIQDPSRPAATLSTHPNAQCRLDTFKAGYFCALEKTCGLVEQRPACWFRREGGDLAQTDPI